MPYPPGGVRTISRPDGSTAESWHAFTCGHCGAAVSGAVVAHHENTWWVICPTCGEGSVRTSGGVVYPTVMFGPEISGLPSPGIAEAYHEARACMSAGAYTACELLCRKILMHIAVEKGAREGDTFVAYLDHLSTTGYITPPMKRWVGLIREHGNSATHKIEPTEQLRAEGTLMFAAELLRLVYEMDHLAAKYAT